MGSRPRHPTHRRHLGRPDTLSVAVGELATMDAAGHEASDALTAALLQITQHAERLAALDERETNHHQRTARRLTELAQQLADTTDAITGIQATTDRQAAILDSLD